MNIAPAHQTAPAQGGAPAGGVPAASAATQATSSLVSASRVARRPLVRPSKPNPPDALYARWALVILVVGLGVGLALPQGFEISVMQRQVGIKQFSGYLLLLMLLFLMAFVGLRRMPAHAQEWVTRLKAWHHAVGLMGLPLLAIHIGRWPRGYLAALMVCLCVAIASGSLRSVMSRHLTPTGVKILLALHVLSASLASAAVLMHVYQVLAYSN